MSDLNSRTPKSPPRIWTCHVPESMARALERRHALNSQQRAFHRDSHAAPPSTNPRPRRPA
jgi:hypothetical protein